MWSKTSPCKSLETLSEKYTEKQKGLGAWFNEALSSIPSIWGWGRKETHCKDSFSQPLNQPLDPLSTKYSLITVLVMYCFKASNYNPPNQWHRAISMNFLGTCLLVRCALVDLG
jgi:hypothetical protein